MLKKMIILLLTALMILTLTACNTEKPVTEESQVNVDAAQGAASGEVTDEVLEDATTETATEETAQNGETAWPVSKMGNMPVPECQVVSVFEYDASSMSGELIIVNYSGMSKEFAASYIVLLAELGFVDGVSLNSEGKILFSGTSQDASAVNFDYDEKTQGGNISYKPVPQ